jgi:hypothetical protein
MWLTRTDMCLESAVATQCVPVAFGGSLSFGYAAGWPVSGLYAGSDAQMITIDDGRTRGTAVVLRLRTNPDVTAFALSLAAGVQPGCAAPWHVTVFDSAGRVLAEVNAGARGSPPLGSGGSSGNCGEEVISLN